MQSHPELASGKMRLNDWSLLHAELDWIYEGRVAPEFQESSQQYPGQSVFLIRRGTLLMRTPAGGVRSKEGEWVLAPTRDHYRKFSSDAEVLSIHFQLHWPGGQPLFPLERAAKLDPAETGRLKVDSERLCRFVARQFPAVASYLPTQSGTLLVHARLRQHFSSWLYIFLQTMLEAGMIPTRAGEIDSRVLEAVQLLDRFPLREPFRQKQFARQVKLSPTHLDRLFVDQFGLTPRRYLEQRRLEQAAMRLRQSSVPGAVKEAAFELGFNSLPHFSGWFRRKTGLSPREFQSGKLGVAEFHRGARLPRKS